MAGSRFGRWPLFIGATFALAACQDNARSNDVVGAAPTFAQAGGQRVTTRDVEAPDVFERRETALWDGRPSLGGVWVAHPDVDSPERVLIENQANGRSIVGALFRRERANPGPRIQLSSDAAGELGILAGQPTMLRVVALKRRDEVVETPPEAAAETPAPAETEAAVAAAPAGGAAQAETEAEAVAAATGASLEASADPAADPTADPAAEVQPVPEDAPPTSFGRRRQAAPAPVAPADAVAEDAPVAAPEAAAATVAPSGEGEAPLSALTTDPQPVAEDAPPTSFGRRRPRPAADDAAAATTATAVDDITTAPLEATASATTAPATAIRFPFIQAAAFGTEANANTAAEQLRAAGIAVEVRQSGSVWRVLAGPVASAAEQASVLENVRRLGYRDAYPVRG